MTDYLDFCTQPQDSSDFPIDKLPNADLKQVEKFLNQISEPLYPILYTRNSNGSVNQWQAILNGDSYIIRHGQVGGKLQDSLPQFGLPKNLGKANETSGAAQARKEVEALYKKQRKSNYFDSIDDIDGGFLAPQLAKPNADYIDDVKWADGQVIDDKLNGFACIITAKGAFTRTNEEYHSIPHILEALEPFFQENPDAYIQGELFNPVYVNELNKIAELIAVTRKPKDITPELLAESKRIVQFFIYDGYGFIMPEVGKFCYQTTPLLERRALIDLLLNVLDSYCLKKVYWERAFAKAEMEQRANQYISEGGEGVIIKNPHAPYQHKRTKDLLKWKKEEDAEFTVIEIEEGTGNWQGCAKKVWCELPDGVKAKKFKSNIEGSQAHLREVWKNRDNWVNKKITVRYQELSPYNVPLIPYTDMVVRKDIEGLDS